MYNKEINIIITIVVGTTNQVGYELIIKLTKIIHILVFLQKIYTTFSFFVL